MQSPHERTKQGVLNPQDRALAPAIITTLIKVLQSCLCNKQHHVYLCFVTFVIDWGKHTALVVALAVQSRVAGVGDLVARKTYEEVVGTRF